MSNSQEVINYYDKFSDNVLLKDFSRRNLRHVALMELCDAFIARGGRILEVGCGAGILSRHLARHASQVVSIDISERNIKLAKKYATSRKNHFVLMDICDGVGDLQARGPFDVILLPDVIEHIPIQKHKKLFDDLKSLLSANGIFILSYPSPAYQRHLKENNQQALQIVDEVVELIELLRDSKLYIRYYALKDVWLHNQYAHLVLSFDNQFQPIVKKLSIYKKLFNIFMALKWKIINYRFILKISNND